MAFLPDFRRGGVLRAADLNALVHAAQQLRSRALGSLPHAAGRGGRGVRLFRRAGDCALLVGAAEDDVFAEACAGGWQGFAQEAEAAGGNADDVGAVAANGGELLLDAGLAPVQGGAALVDRWEPAGAAQLVARPVGQSQSAAWPGPLYGMARQEFAEGGFCLEAEGMGYGRPAAPIWFKDASATPKESAYAQEAVLAPGPWQTLFLQQASHYYRAGNSVRANVWAWGLQGRMDRFGYVSFRPVCRERGPWHFGLV